MFAVCAVAADRLENTYLPPVSAKTAGGGGFLAAPQRTFNAGAGSSYVPPASGPVPSQAYNGPSVRTYSGHAGDAPVAILRFNNDNAGDGTYRFEWVGLFYHLIQRLRATCYRRTETTNLHKIARISVSMRYRFHVSSKLQKLPTFFLLRELITLNTFISTPCILEITLKKTRFSKECHMCLFIFINILIKNFQNFKLRKLSAQEIASFWRLVSTTTIFYCA